MRNATPLIRRNLADTLFIDASRRISCAVFLGQVHALAAALPDAPVAINLCENRHAFILGLFAAIVRGQTNLLPPTRQPGVIRETVRDSKDAYVLHDGGADAADGRPFDISPFLATTDESDSIPLIPDTHLAAVVHTSGSTGTASRLKKYWGTFSRGIEIDLGYLRDDPTQAVGIVSTVPPWHMYGIELTVLLPMVSNTAVFTGSSLFPDDIRAALERMDAPRMLVSTPVHLRAIVRAQLELPQVEKIICATAPLSLSLAQEVERTFSGRLLDMYGCSEVGLIGYRWLTQQPEWTFFAELGVARDGEQATISAEHLPAAVTLSDSLEFLPEGRFNVLGRSEELVKIGGKRGSLADMTHRLLTIDGVQDGVIFRRSGDGNGDGDGEVRLSAVVVSPSRSAQEIRSALAEVIDPVFLPRPIRLVDELPRSRTGKLRKADLEKITAARVP